MEINELYSKYEQLKELVGADALLEEFVQQMSSDDLQDYLQTAYKNFDIDFDE